MSEIHEKLIQEHFDWKEKRYATHSVAQVLQCMFGHAWAELPPLASGERRKLCTKCGLTRTLMQSVGCRMWL